MKYALSISPLSKDFLEQLEIYPNDNWTCLLLGELRRLSLKRLIKTLRNIKTSKLILPFEDSNSLSLLPVLTSVAAITRAKTIEIVYPDLSRKTCNRIAAFPNLTRFVFASWQSKKSLNIARHKMQNLLAQNRIVPKPSSNNHVVYINANLWFGVKAGGSVGHIAGVINALHDKDYNVDYAAVSEAILVDEAVNYHPLELLRTFGFPAEANYYRFNQQVTQQLTTLYADKKPRFIYQRMSSANYAGVSLSRQLNVPLIIEYNGSEVWIAENWGKGLKYAKEALMAENVCLAHAHVIVTISDVLKDELIERGVEPNRIVSYPNCIAPKIFDPERYSDTDKLTLRESLSINPNDTVLTFVGTFGQWHGVDVLAQAIRKLIDTQKEWLIENKVKFLLVGDGLKMPEVRKLLPAEIANQFVIMPGLVAQTKAPLYLAASDILLSPHVANSDGSKFFGSPTKLFEYMAMGKAIIASDLDQIGQVLQNSLHSSRLDTDDKCENPLSVLCTPGEIDELIKAIKYLVERPKLAKQLGQNARKEALSKYTWDHHVTEIIKTLESVL